MKKKTAKTLLLISILAILLGLGWSGFEGLTGPPVVSITNESTHTLVDVMITGDGSGWSQRIGDIPPGASTAVCIRALQGESGLRIDFKANGGAITKRDLAYLEESLGYTARVTVGPKLNVQCVWNSTSWHWRRLY